jgi:hypothetical protein
VEGGSKAKEEKFQRVDQSKRREVFLLGEFFAEEKISDQGQERSRKWT